MNFSGTFCSKQFYLGGWEVGTKIRRIACSVVFYILLLPIVADALPIKINPGRFQGKWRVGTSNMKVGPATLDLLPGQTYNLNIDQIGNLPFTVLSDGTVSSNHPMSATGSGDTLSLKTVPVLVKTGKFAVPWHLSAISAPKVGPGGVALIPGLTYELSFGDMGSFLFDLLANGTVRSHHPESARGAGNTLTFNTTPVSINPERFPASWYVADISTPQQGPNTLDLMPGLTYDLSISNIGGFQFSVSDKGVINSLNSESALGGNNKLTFKTTPVSIDPGDFLGAWLILHISKPQFGTGQTHLIPGLTYSLSINGIGRFQFDVKADGAIRSRHPESARGSGNILIFKTTPIRVKQGTSLKTWVIPWIPTGLSPDTVHLVPGLTYTLLSGGIRGKFMLGGPCAITPSTLILNKSTFHLVCVENLNRPPIAVPGPNQKIPLGKTALLDGSSSSDPDGDLIASYRWSIDSAPVGSKEIISNGNHAKVKFTPDKTGNYLLSLKVSDGKLNSQVKTVRLSVVENRAPEIKASATPDSGLAALKVWFDATSSSDPDGGRLNYAWDFGDPESRVDNFSVLGLLSHVYRDPGRYTATLTVSDNFGKKSVTTFDIHVKGPDLPPTAVLAALPLSYKTPLSIQFTSNANDPEGALLSYLWDFGDGSDNSTKVNPIHQYTTGGSYDVRLIVSDGVHAVEATNTVEVTAPMDIHVQKTKANFREGGDGTDRVLLDIGFVPDRQIGDGDLIKVVFDGATLFEIPFGQFIEMHDTPGKFTYKAKNLKVRMDVKKGLLQVIRQEMELNRDGSPREVELLVIFGRMAGVEPVYFNGTTFLKQKRSAEAKPK